MTLGAFMLILAYVGLGFTIGFFYGSNHGRTSGKIEGWVRAHVDMLKKIKTMKQDFVPKPTKRELILVIDDNEDVRAMLTAILHLYGYDVIEAEMGAEGLAKALSHNPSAAIIDIKLPGGMDGFEVAKKIRKDKRTSKMRLVALSGYDIDNAKFNASGFDKYLMKPYNLDRLVESLSVSAKP